MRTYSELIRYRTFQERLDYLCLGSMPGDKTFGGSRFVNQSFYRSKEWRNLRNHIVSRDSGCDLGVPGMDIPNGKKVIIHHLEPLELDDVLFHSDCMLDPENLITTTFETHNIIHYGTETSRNAMCLDYIERTPDDMIPWKLEGDP